MSKTQMTRRRRAFLDHFARYGNISAAARQAGIERKTVYRWQEHDDAFAAAFRDAELQAVDVLAEEAWRRAHDGVESTRTMYWRGEVVGVEQEIKYSDRLLEFLLKGQPPTASAEGSRLQHAGANGEQLDLAALVGLARATVSDADATG